MKSCMTMAQHKVIRNVRESSALKHEYMGRYIDTNERISHDHQYKKVHHFAHHDPLIWM